MDGERKVGTGVRITLDPESIRSCMKLWRDSADVRIPMKDEFKLHFIARRREILSNFERAAGNWLTAFAGAVPDVPDRVGFEGLLADIREFQEWAKAGISEFDRLGKEE